MSGAATDGKTALTAPAKGRWAIGAGSVRERIRRATGRAESLAVPLPSVPPEPFGSAGKDHAE